MMNPMQIMNAVRNPQAFLQQMMNNNPQMKNNPMAQNILNMAQSGNVSGIEQFGRNMAKERGVDFDQAFSDFKNQFGVK
jgi:hypothetical protein